MPRTTFLLQGLTAQTHMEVLTQLLGREDLDKALLSVAFVTKSGAELVARELTLAGKRADIFVGIRNGVTTREGLEALLRSGANLYYVDTGARDLLFHPKIYICRCGNQATGIVGSANLTVGGLRNNIESSVVFELNLDQEEDLLVASSVFSQFDQLASSYPQHVGRVTRSDQLASLHSQGRLVDETDRHRALAATRAVDDLPTMELKALPLRTPSRRPETAAPSSPSVVESPETVAWSRTTFVQVWRSKALTERDLGIPSNPGTHPTGSINLDKGRLPDGVDHRHYFRSEVFSELEWNPRSHTVDEAHASFRLIVRGVDRGTFRLRIRHTTSTTSKAYRQRNAMTRLSWGDAREFVAKRSLIGRTMELHRESADPDLFAIIIP